MIAEIPAYTIANYLRETYDPHLDYPDAEINACAAELSQLGFVSTTSPTREQAECMNRHLGGSQWEPYDEDALAELAA
jgi:hypothetical protein